MNLEDEEPIEKHWSLKRPRLGQGGQKPSQHKHTSLLTLRLNVDNNNGAPNGKKRMKPLKEGHYPNKGGLKEKQLKPMHTTHV